MDNNNPQNDSIIGRDQREAPGQNPSEQLQTGGQPEADFGGQQGDQQSGQQSGQQPTGQQQPQGERQPGQQPQGQQDGNVDVDTNTGNGGNR